MTGYIVSEQHPMGPVHVRHSVDGYPLCWPLDADGEFRGTRDENLATCEECKQIVAELEAS